MIATGLIALAPLALASPPTDAVEADDLREVREELRGIREMLELQRAENQALRDALRHADAGPQGRPGLRRAEPVERVSFGDSAWVRFGEVVDDVAAFGSDVRVEGTVLGNATAFGGDVVITETGVVRGDAVAFGGVVRVHPEGRVEGDRMALDGPVSAGVPTSGASMLSDLYHRAVLLLSFAGAGVLVVGLFPNRVERIARGLESQPIWSGIVGATVASLITVFSGLFALLTVGLGLPVSLVMMAVLGAAWLFGFVGLCQAIGDRLPFAEKPHGRWLTFLVGTVLLSCIGSLPWVGWMVVGAASLVGIGAAVTSRFGGS